MTWRGGEARNEVRFRDQNEWVEAASESYGATGLLEFVCECGDASCSEVIQLSRESRQSSKHACRLALLELPATLPELTGIRGCERRRGGV